MIYHWCCITKGESTMLVFMWHHTWMTSSDPVLHCSSSWCHLSRQLVSNNSVCIARWWAITISSRGCGNVVTVSVSPACSWLLKLPSHDHQISFVNKDCVYIHASEKKAVKCWFFFWWEFRADNYRSCCYVWTQGKQCLCSVKSSFLYEVVIPTQAW